MYFTLWDLLYSTAQVTEHSCRILIYKHIFFTLRPTKKSTYQILAFNT